MNEPNNVSMDGGESRGGSAGPIIGAIIILAIIILGGFYFWSQRADDSDAAINGTVESINTQGTSDEAAAIEADLNNTNIENLDSELNAS